MRLYDLEWDCVDVVPGLNRLLARMQRSDFVQSRWNTSPMLWEGQHGSRVIHHNIALETFQKHLGGLIGGLMWAHLGLSGSLEASRGQTKQIMVGLKAVYGILEQVGSI